MSAPTRSHFVRDARGALADAKLRAALLNIKTMFRNGRARQVAAVPEFEELRDAGAALKREVIDNLDAYLARFAAEAESRGAKVHFCADAKDARETIAAICREQGAKLVTKGKSMVTEEIGLNPYLVEQGFTPVETDLGEYIIQLRDEPPSHIIAPAVHVKKEQVAETFRAAHAELPPERDLSTHDALLAEARAELRARFLSADVGITGANMLVAETGQMVLVTNEGNGDLTQTLPKCHVIVASIEKLVPSLDDAATVLRLLGRSATGQHASSYTTLSVGTRREGEVDGPETCHVVLVDNGRSAMLGTPFEDMLRCIRCGACINHCPVFVNVGGHAYGAVYVGPIVITSYSIHYTKLYDDPDAETKRRLLGALSEIAHRLDLRLSLCGQPDLILPGIHEAACVDAERLSRVAGYAVAAKNKPHRATCRCAQSRDIGTFATCKFGCRYCYVA